MSSPRALSRAIALASALALVPLALTGCSITATPVAESPTVAPVEPEKTEAPSEPTAGFTQLTDETGAIFVEVPDSWVQTDGAPQDPAVILSASPDLQSFYSSYDVPGVTILATQSETVGVDGYIEKYSTEYGGDCAASQTDTYDDGFYTGKYLYLTACGGTGDLAVVAVTDPDDTMIVLVTMQLVSDDDKNINGGHILQTFFVQF